MAVNLQSKRLHNITEEQWELAHLQLKDSLELTKTPFNNISDYDLEHPDEHLLKIMMNPDYFGWTCGKLFNTAVSENGLELLPMQCAILREMWRRPFPMLIATRGFGKSFTLALYVMLRALFIQGRKIVITGAGFRQSKIVFSYAELLWKNSPIFRELCGAAHDKDQGPHHDTDMWWMQIGDSQIKALPLGDGSKIRGQRAHDIIADEFACVGPNTIVDTDKGLARIVDLVGKDFQVFTGNNTDLEKPQKFIVTPPTKGYKVTTVGGYEFICSGIHQVYTVDGWKLGKDLQKGDLLQFCDNYIFPSENADIIDSDLAWLMGMLVAEGSINNDSQISVKMTDRDCIMKIHSLWDKYAPNSSKGFFTKEAYVDDRGWNCKESYTTWIYSKTLRDKLEGFGLDKKIALNKYIPSSILSSSKTVVLSFLRGLFEGDGSAFLWTDREIKNKFGVAYYSSSKQLCQEVQIILRKLGLFSTLGKRRSKISNNWQWAVRLNGLYALKLQEMLNIEKWSDMYEIAHHPIERGDVGVVWDKSRSKWKVDAMINGRKKYVGRFSTKQEALDKLAETSDKVDYIEVKSVEVIEEPMVLYDFYLPKSHSFIGNCFKQHNSIPQQVFEEVVAGFGVVNIDPIAQVKHYQRLEYLKELGEEDDSFTDAIQEAETDSGFMPNQLIISGTASFAFNQFYAYWKKQHNIITSQGDSERLKNLGLDPNLDHKKYSIVRIPVDLLPKGFMDQAQIERSRATLSVGIYNNEFGACFSADSSGFFRRSILEKAMPSFKNPVILPSGESVEVFSALLKGDKEKKYIMGVDTASERDKFAITILETYEDHARIVYCWTIDRQELIELRSKGLVQEKDFFAYTVRKIRNLMKSFNIVHIIMDSQGGGRTVAEALHNEANLEPGEQLIWELSEGNPLWDGTERETDGERGLHILELVNFRNNKFLTDANHGMKHDFEQRILLFPYFDAIEVVVAGKDDSDAKREYDTLQDVLMEIDSLKDELQTIMHDQTPSGNETFTLPKIKQTGDVGRLYDDRYTALLIANSAARRLREIPKQPEYYVGGGFVGQLSSDGNKPKQLYSGPAWFTEATKNISMYGIAVKR